MNVLSACLSLGTVGKKKGGRPEVEKQNQKKSRHGVACANAAEESKDVLTKQARNAEAEF